MHPSSPWPLLGLSFPLSLLSTATAACPPFSGPITISAYQLYPENADFDPVSCQLYLGAVYNASVVVYDPYRAAVSATLEFAGITRTAPSHIGGVARDPTSGHLTVLVDAAPAHETAGRDLAGDNYLLRLDPDLGVRWFVNLTATSRGRYGGPQDVEHDARGRTYVLGTYPGTLLRVSPDGADVAEWYLPPAPLEPTHAGFTGLAAVGGGSDILLVSDSRNNSGDGGALYKFDMAADTGTPTRIPLIPADATLRPGDAVYLPPKYGGRVLLVAEHERGVAVLRSRDGSWDEAEYVGLVPNDAKDPGLEAGALVVAPVEIAGSLYMVEEWFGDALVPGTSAGNRTEFPLVDITEQVQELLDA
ncbi:hypothetical protein F4780DRAFT_781259 [Xylariomycetidae sp. FL0641]|nr:hypothetical protein F4780DRAFT_781259 [Xylariomycetidae sp. FL0641]